MAPYVPSGKRTVGKCSPSLNSIEKVEFDVEFVMEDESSKTRMNTY